jgi:hypothetical protein
VQFVWPCGTRSRVCWGGGGGGWGVVGGAADGGVGGGGVEGPGPRSWYVMNPVYFGCSMSRTWSVYLLRIPQTDGCISFSVLLCQLKRWENLHFVY